MHNYLKVKLLSLQEEAKIIKKEEEKQRRKIRGPSAHPETIEYHQKILSGLHKHRIEDVREEARKANLAYGFCCGKEYQEIEYRAFEEPDWHRVKTLILRYGEGDKDELKTRLKEWIEKAKEFWYVGMLELQKKRDLKHFNRKLRRANRREENESALLDPV